MSVHLQSTGFIPNQLSKSNRIFVLCVLRQSVQRFATEMIKASAVGAEGGGDVVAPLAFPSSRTP